MSDSDRHLLRLHLAIAAAAQVITGEHIDCDVVETARRNLAGYPDPAAEVVRRMAQSLADLDYLLDAMDLGGAAGTRNPRSGRMGP